MYNLKRKRVSQAKHESKLIQIRSGSAFQAWKEVYMYMLCGEVYVYMCVIVYNLKRKRVSHAKHESKLIQIRSGSAFQAWKKVYMYILCGEVLCMYICVYVCML